MTRSEGELLAEYARRLLQLLVSINLTSEETRAIVPMDRVEEAILATLREDLPVVAVTEAMLAEGVDFDLVYPVPGP